MKKMYPHEVYKADFDELIQEAIYQERSDPQNFGEIKIATALHDYFEEVVIPDISNDDVVYEAASVFARDYALQCIDYLALGGQETFQLRGEFDELKKEIIELIKSLGVIGFLNVSGELKLPKASDFYNLIDLNKARLNKKLMRQIDELHMQSIRIERLQLLATIRSLRDGYETILPRIMFVIRRSLSLECNILLPEDHGTLKGISEYISWYDENIPEDHALNIVFEHLQSFYKIARNVGNHHKGFIWEPELNQIELPDIKKTIIISSQELIQKYRYLVYLNSFGMRAILKGYSERAKNNWSYQLLNEYILSFPDGFGAKEEAIVIPYE